MFAIIAAILFAIVLIRDRANQDLGDVLTPHAAHLPGPLPAQLHPLVRAHIARDASPSRRGNSWSRSLWRARWRRTLAADSEMPSSAAIDS